MVDLRITVDGVASPTLTRAWHALQISLGVGLEQDAATLTIAAASTITLPDAGAVLRFVADGGTDLGTFAARALSGSTRDGTIVIECAAIDPEAALRKPRDRTWAGQSLDSMVRTIAADAGLTPAVHSQIGGVVLAARPQVAVSDLAFLQRLVERLQGRLIIQEGRLIVSLADAPAVALPTLNLDVRGTGAWIEWRRGWSDTLQRVEAAYVREDGVTIDAVVVGAGGTTRRLPTTYASRVEAEAAAMSHLMAGDVSRDVVEVSTGLLPAAQVLQPLELVGADDRIPIAFPALVIHTVQHTLGRSVSATVLTARPAAARS